MSNTCIVVADGARARFFITQTAAEGRPGSSLRLTELEALTNPEGELTGNQTYANIRSGSNRAPGGRAFEYDDHRARHHEEVERRFARQVAASTLEFVRRQHADNVVLAVEPHMLGLLREQLGHSLPSELKLVEFAEDLTWHTPEHIQAALERRGAWSSPPRA